MKVEVSELLLCTEHTGQYDYPLSCACGVMKVDLCGWRISLKSSIHSVFSGVKTTGLTLENDRLRIAFSGQGQPVFIVRKTDGEFEMPDERA